MAFRVQELVTEAILRRSRALFRYSIAPSSLILPKVEHPPAVIDLTLSELTGFEPNKFHGGCGSVGGLG